MGKRIAAEGNPYTNQSITVHNGVKGVSAEMAGFIADSGNRREFSSGAVRDIVDGKGRCDLMPLEEIADVLESDDKDSSVFLRKIGEYIYTGDIDLLISALKLFILSSWSYSEYFLELSHHYENGCIKYGERNWEKGIPLHSYIDSAVRHYFKWKSGWTDEPHHLAVGWNLLCAMWTAKRFPELIDLPFVKNKVRDDTEG